MQPVAVIFETLHINLPKLSWFCRTVITILGAVGKTTGNVNGTLVRVLAAIVMWTIPTAKESFKSELHAIPF